MGAEIHDAQEGQGDNKGQNGSEDGVHWVLPIIDTWFYSNFLDLLIILPISLGMGTQFTDWKIQKTFCTKSD